MLSLSRIFTSSIRFARKPRLPDIQPEQKSSTADPVESSQSWPYIRAFWFSMLGLSGSYLLYSSFTKEAPDHSASVNKHSTKSWFKEQAKLLQQVSSPQSPESHVKTILDDICRKEFYRLLLTSENVELSTIYDSIVKKSPSKDIENLHPILKQYFQQLLQSETPLSHHFDTKHLFAYTSKNIKLSNESGALSFIHTGYINTRDQCIELYQDLFHDLTPQERSFYIAQPLVRLSTPGLSSRDMSMIVFLCVCEAFYLLTRRIVRGHDPPIQFFYRIPLLLAVGRAIQVSSTFLQDKHASDLLSQAGLDPSTHPYILKSLFLKTLKYDQSFFPPSDQDNWFQTIAFHGTPPIDSRVKQLEDYWDLPPRVSIDPPSSI